MAENQPPQSIPDQAATLRKIVGLKKEERNTPLPLGDKMRVICVTSGKGGVGKTNIVVNLCLALTQLNKRVFLLDADMGLANVDVMLGISPKYTLEHLMKGQKTIQEIVLENSGFRLLPASSGITELAEMTHDQQMFLFQQLSNLDDDIDYLFIDTGAGISTNVLRFNASANEVIIVATPEPTSMTDAYALMKLLVIKYHLRGFYLVANMVADEKEGMEVYKRLNSVCLHFLNVRLGYLGYVPQDGALRKAVRLQVPLLKSFPDSLAAKSLKKLALQLEATPDGPFGIPSLTDPPPVSPQTGFWDRLLHWKKV